MPQTLKSLQEALTGRYEIEREAGHGGMATVFRATDVKHHRPVAIKVLRPEIAAILGSDRFLQEIEIAARLQHPHILPLHDSGQADGLLYYVMPFVEGQSLRERLGRERQLPLEDALQITREVGDALDYAHGNGVVHRDIKPENILWTGGHAIVTDFGIARAISMASGQTITRTGVVLGTPTYMSPEQATGAPQLDGRSDLYSLGCVLYEMLAGEPPFTGPTESVVYQHLTAQAKPVTALRSAVPPHVAAALTRALAKTPADRFTSSAQFTAALLQPATPLGVSVAVPLPARRERRLPRPGRRMLAEVLGFVLLVAAATFFVRGCPLVPGLGAGQIRSIAVLPLDSFARDPEQEYFADGMTERLIAALAELKGVSVTSRTSVMGYKGERRKSAPRIARELNVDAILEGSVMRSGRQVRIIVQLIRAAKDEHVWAETYERNLEDVFQIQSEVARAISREIGLKLAPVGEPRVASAADPAAQDAYLKGCYFANQPNATSIQKGMEFFRRALARDPNYALAYSGLADTYILLAQEGLEDPDTAYAEAKELAGKGVAVEPELAEAHASMATAYLYSWQWADAEREFQKAIELKPSYAAAHNWYANYLLAAGRREEAIAEARRAWELDPQNQRINWNLGLTLHYGRRYEESAEHFRHILEASADTTTRPAAHLWLGLTLEQRGRLEEAILEFRKVDGPAALAPLAHAYALSGRERQAREILRQFLDYAATVQGYVPALEIATIYAGLGEKDQALAWLNKAYETRAGLLLYLQVEPIFDVLRDDPRFGDLVRRVGLPVGERTRRGAA